MDKKIDFESEFLEDVGEQIAYRPLRPSVLNELQDHIEDRTEEYEAAGLSPEMARRKAVASMGDAVSIGTQINAVRCVRSNWPLVFLTVLLVLAGWAAASFMQWTPEQTANGFLYYLPGIAFLVFITFKGYPWLIRYQTKILALSAGLFLAGAVFLILWRMDIVSPEMACFPFFSPWSIIFYYLYYGTLLLGPILAILLYRMRRNVKKAFWVLALLAATPVLLNMLAHNSFWGTSAVTVFLCSMAGTLLFMIYQGVFPGSMRRLFVPAALGCFLVLGIYALLPDQSFYFKVFAQPETMAGDPWDDAYNSVLMKELLSKTPVLGGIQLTPEEMMEYGSGLWYFDTDTATPPQYINFDEADVTLWDILPQHYHNNYLIAVIILLFGWLPGILFLSLVAAFFWFLFSCIRQIHGNLASVVSFYCGLCLLFQSILYILGNFGFQYGAFPNLPLISEGKVSILVNVLLLGFIFSAYRYDRVIDEPVCKETISQKEAHDAAAL